MKRDMDLIRELLLDIEKNHDGSGRLVPIETEGNSPAIIEHLFLLNEAGLIEGQDASHLAGRNFLVQRMTWSGHDFLDSIRDPEIWKKTKEGAASVKGFSLDLVKALAKGLIKTQLEERTGVKLDF